MSLIGKLKEGTVWIDGIPEVRPQRKVSCRKQSLSLDGGQPTASVQTENLVTQEGTHCSRKQS